MSARPWFRLHSLAGTVAGLLLFVVCWTGTFATLSTEIDWLLTPAMRAASSGSFDPDAIEAAALRAHPDAKLLWMSRPQQAGFAVDVVLEAPPYKMRHVYVDPVQAQARGGTSYFNVQRFFRSLHMALFLPFGIGIYLVGAAGVFLVLSFVTPLVFYKRWWTRWFRLRTDGGPRAVTSEAHKLAGLWSLWFVGLVSLTGVWYLAEQVMIDVADVDYIYPAAPEYTGPVEPRLPLSRFVEEARKLRPELDVSVIGTTGDGLVQVSGQAGDLLTRDRANSIFFAPTTAQAVEIRRASELGPLRRWIEMVDLLHFGTLGGLPTKIVWFFFGVLLSGLCLTGAFLHWCRLSASGGHRARWPGIRIAVACTAGLLAVSAGGGVVEARRFGPLVDNVQSFPELSPAVLAFMILWTLATGLLVALWTRWLWRLPAVARQSR